MKRTSLVSFILGLILVTVPSPCASLATETPSESMAEVERHFEKANELLNDKQYKAAIAELEEVMAVSPNSRIAQDAQYWVGQAHFLSGHFDAAQASFAQLIERHPSSAIVPATGLMIERVQQSKEEKTLVDAIIKGDVEQLKLLISKGADVNAKVKAEVAGGNGKAYVLEGWTLLNLAILHEHPAMAAFLIDNGADVNGRDDWGNCKFPLNWVAHDGTAGLAELLIAKGADVNAQEKGGYTPLYNAATSGNLEVVQVLIAKGADIDVGPSNTRWTPLSGALHKGHLDIAKFLIAKGAGIETRDKLGFTPLINAAKVNSTEMVRLLLEKGASADSSNFQGKRSLHFAVQKGNQAMVELLLDHGAQPARFLGVDLVGMAMERNQKKMVKFLVDRGLEHSGVHVATFFGDVGKIKHYLANGGDINALDPSRLSLLVCAISGRQTEAAELLLSEGADVNQKCAQGNTALHWTTSKGGTEFAKMLLDQGADVTMTTLRSAVYLARRDMVAMLIAGGVDINTRFVRFPKQPERGRNWTLLHTACLNLNRPWHRDSRVKKAIVELLVAKGADVNAKAQDGTTPLSLLKQGGHEDLIELLRKHGAEE